jgi:hypothetical protein
MELTKFLQVLPIIVGTTLYLWSLLACKSKNQRYLFATSVSFFLFYVLFLCYFGENTYLFKNSFQGLFWAIFGLLNIFWKLNKINLRS